MRLMKKTFAKDCDVSCKLGSYETLMTNFDRNKMRTSTGISKAIRRYKVSINWRFFFYGIEQ
jgi:hypothetical protein